MREQELVSRIEPIRQMFFAQAVHELIRLGIATAVQEGTGVSPEELAKRLGLDSGRLDALLEYAVNEELLFKSNGLFSSTLRLREYCEVAPWYEMLVGGYGRSFLDLHAVLRDGSLYADRNLSWVARGSSGISLHDAVPVIIEILRHCERPTRITDLGSADGVYLRAIAEDLPDVSMTAVEPNNESATRARINLANIATANVVTGTAQDYVANLEAPAGTFIIAFVLHEILAQNGEEYLVAFLQRLLSGPENRLIIVEVDRGVQPDILTRGLGSSYYNPYFLLHGITQQELRDRDYWLSIVERAGGIVEKCLHPDHELDPTEAEFVLSVKGRSQGDISEVN